MIKKYRDALNEMGQLYGGEEKNELILQGEKDPKEDTSIQESNESAETEKALNDTENSAYDANESLSADESVNEEDGNFFRAPSVMLPEGEMTDFAYFTANVFSGEETYPVEKAKIVIYRGDNIYAFLSTDESGKTKKIKLPAFNRENSLESDNPDKTVSYQADIFAEGFVAQKGLLVDAVGGSDIVLKVILVPEEERIG